MSSSFIALSLKVVRFSGKVDQTSLLRLGGEPSHRAIQAKQKVQGTKTCQAQYLPVLNRLAQLSP